MNVDTSLIQLLPKDFYRKEIMQINSGWLIDVRIDKYSLTKWGIKGKKRKLTLVGKFKDQSKNGPTFWKPHLTIKGPLNVNMKNFKKILENRTVPFCFHKNQYDYVWRI